MTTTNQDLAARAQQLARGADGLDRRAYLCVSVALATTTTGAAARRSIDLIEQPDVRTAARVILDELAGERSTP